MPPILPAFPSLTGSPGGLSCLPLPWISHGDQKDLRRHANRFAATFLGGAAFGIGNALTQSVLTTSFSEVDLDLLLHSAVSIGLDLACYPFLYNTAFVVFKPDLSELPKWVGWTASVAAISAVVRRFVTTATRNFLTQGRLSVDSWWIPGYTPMAIFHSVGFHVGAGAAHYYLPSAGRLGGPDARNWAIESTGLATAVACEIPFTGSVSGALRKFCRDLPGLLAGDGLTHTLSARLPVFGLPNSG
jgi:hypothetical protein